MASHVTLPILLVASGFAGLATYYKESRQETLKQTHEDLIKEKHELQQILDQSSQVTTLTNLYTYSQPPTIKHQGKHSYIPPNVMGVLKVGLDLALAGIVCGVSSWSFACTVATYTHAAYSEIRNYSKIKKINKEIKTLRKTINTQEKPEQSKKHNATNQKWQKKIKNEKLAQLHKPISGISN